MAMTKEARQEYKVALRRVKAARFRIVVAGANFKWKEVAEMLGYPTNSLTAIYRLRDGKQLLSSDQSMTLARNAAGRDAWVGVTPNEIFALLEDGMVLQLAPSPALRMVAENGERITNGSPDLTIRSLDDYRKPVQKGAKVA